MINHILVGNRSAIDRQVVKFNPSGLQHGLGLLCV